MAAAILSGIAGGALVIPEANGLARYSEFRSVHVSSVVTIR